MSDQLENIRLQLLKKFGPNSVITGADMEEASFGRISTGSVSLDLKIGGGIPIGRMVQIAGAKSSTKSTLCDHIIKNAQATSIDWVWVERKEVKGREVVEKHNKSVKGLICGYLDVEGTKTVEWSRDVIGVNTDLWMYAKPSGMEETLNMAHDMQKLGVQFIVIDSVDALQSLKDFEAETGESTQMGIKPKAIGEYCRKFTATNNKLVREGHLPCTLIFINQVRDKIGTYGCLHSSTLVNFADGRSIPIGKVVKEKIQGEVWSYNEKTHKIEPRKILSWHYNGAVKDNKDYLTIRSYCPHNKNGVASLTVTPNHKVLTQEGWKEARELTLEDNLIAKDVTKLNGTLLDFLRGISIGDSSLVTKVNTTCIRFQDNENRDYMNWKVSKLKPHLNFKEYSNHFESGYLNELTSFKEELRGNRNPLGVLDKFTDLSLAVWYMDDGHYREDRDSCSISIKRFKGDEATLLEIQDKLTKMGLPCTYYLKEGTIAFSKEVTEAFHKRICKFVPPCMQYKLLEKFREKYEDFHLANQVEIKGVPVPILSIEVSSNKKMRSKGKYDLSIEGNKNYLVGGKHNGVIVHNSPEFTPGGKAIDFYVSLDLRLRRGDWITIGKGDNKEVVGQVVKFKSLKNKTYKQQQDGSYDFYFEDADVCKQGQIDNFKEVILEGAEWGIITRAGAWFRFNGQNLAQGMDNTVAYLRENLDVFIQIKDELFKKVAEEEARLLANAKSLKNNSEEDKSIEEPKEKAEPTKKTKSKSTKKKK